MLRFSRCRSQRRPWPARSSDACRPYSATMSESLGGLAAPVLELRGISKRYRLYQKPLYRFLDLFGMCPADSAHYSEHVALDAVDLSVGRGEKVAIIGRNGAGKSTMLKV